MATLSLKISLDEGAVVKTMQFDPSTTVYDACRYIRERRLQDASGDDQKMLGDPKEYGLFLTSGEDSKKGVWLEPARALDYYILRNGDVLHYSRKTRSLRVRTLDGTVKTMLVDDSQVVANLMVVICTKIGITNYDEYGLVREDVKEESEQERGNYGTLTMRRRHQERDRDAKMDQLRRKLRTDDEVNWVEPSKTLREQGVEPGETLLLRRRLFYSDRNVDSRDPVQLNLLYVQARDAILEGKHPVTQDKACEFAGIQCQIQFGDHKEDKHTSGFLDLKEFLPASYVKVKGIEKKIFKEHRKHAGLSELDAKVLYTKSARSLKTYGVAFFLVKEKMKGKNKLVPRLLGVRKDSVLRLDEKTKETLQTWPLTTVRRWCASANTFTLDFGDYSDQYYSVQTTDAEQILQVISGYIDIILKRRDARDHLGIEGDEGSAMLEDAVTPNKANIIQHDSFKPERVTNESLAMPAVIRPGAGGAKSAAVGHVQSSHTQIIVSGSIVTGHAPPNAAQTQQTHLTAAQTPQRALLSTISSGQEIIQKTEMSLQRASLPPLGDDAASIKWKQSTMDSSKQLVTSQIAAMNAATAQVVTLTSGTTEEVDHTAVGAAITTITSNLPEMSKGVQMIAALLDDTDNGDRLLDATRKLCSAFTDLLKAAEPETKEPRQSLLNAASRVGEASTSVLHTIGEETDQDKETQDILLSLAKAVATTTAALVLRAKHVSEQCKDEPQAHSEIIAAATHCALATSQLVAAAKVVAPTLNDAACRQQLAAAARQVAQAVERLLAACPANKRKDLPEAARAVTAALDRLLAHCDADRSVPVTASETIVEEVMIASEQVTSAGDTPSLLRHARSLGQATAELIADIKTEAEKQPSDQQRRLLAAAKLLADATARMVEAARQCASSPQDHEAQNSLRRAAEELRDIAADYARGGGLAKQHALRLQEAARKTAAAATQLCAAAAAAYQTNTNKYSAETLQEECEALSEQAHRVTEVSAQPPEGAAAQLTLLHESEALLQNSGRAVAAARGAVPTVAEPAAARNLTQAAHTLTNVTHELRSAVSRSHVSCKGLELDAAAESIRALQTELRQLRRASLRPLPNQTEQWAASTLHSASREARAHTAALVAAARDNSDEGCARAAGALAASLRDYTGGVVAAASHTPEQQDRIITSGSEVLESSYTLVETVQRYMSTSETVHLQTIITSAKDLSQGLERTLEAIPSHEELDEAMQSISETRHILQSGELPQRSDKDYASLQSSLTEAARALGGAALRVTETADAPAQLAPAARDYGEAFTRLAAAALDMAAVTEEEESRTLMISSMETVTTTSSKLLGTAKSFSQDLTRPNARNQLTDAARAVTDAINRLVDVCTEAAPGQKECEAAIRSIEATRPLLAAALQPVSELGYFACLDSLVDQSKNLSEGMSRMAGAVKESQHAQLASGARAVADAVQGLVEGTAQAAYLVGVSDPSSVAGRAGLVDQAALARAAAAIERACATLSAPRSSQSAVLAAATQVARHTSALCNACRFASARSPHATHKRHFVQAAKDVANPTAALVHHIKALDQNYTEEKRERCANATVPLLEAVRSLCQFADSPEFASVPAKISAQARNSQEAILDCGRNIISGSCSMIESAKVLALSPQERTQWQALATHSKTVSDSIKSLVANIRDKAPGQRECAAALETLTKLTRDLDQAAISAVGQELPPSKDNTFDGFVEQIENSLSEVLEHLEPLRVAAKSEAENLGHAVLQTISYVEPLMTACTGAASLLPQSEAQGSLLRSARTVLETLTALVRAARHSAGNARATSAHPEVDSQSQAARSALTELGAGVRESCVLSGGATALLDTVRRTLARLSEHRMSFVGSYDETDSFVDYQTRMVAAAKEIARLATDMTAKSATDAARLMQLGGELCAGYEKLAGDSGGACATTPNADVAVRLRNSVVDLGSHVAELIEAGGRCHLSPAPQQQRAVADAASHVNEKVISVLSALQAGSRGTQACIDAAATIAAILGDLETTILFASAGTLQSEREGDTFSDHRESILKTAKSLVEDTKSLVGGAAGSQDHLAAAAQSAVSTIVQLCEVVKQGAMSLGAANPESQVLLLNAARDVACALRDLAVATKGASGKHVAHPDMERLKQSAKVMVTNVTSLLKTVKAVEDEHTRGTRALESTIEAISQEIAVLMSPNAPKSSATAEELVRHTRQMTAATARAVSAGNSGKQEQLTAAANLGRRTVLELLAACKGAAFNADTESLRARTLTAGRDAALSYRALLAAVLGAAGGEPAARAQLPDLSRRVAHSVADILAAAQLLKGSDWVDPDDPTVIAESELLGAAASIDAAAKKLESLRPRKSMKVQEADESLNFDEMILEAAKSIVAATSALVRAASAAQRELIDQGKVARQPTSSSDDGQWSEGLISAARLVAAAAHALVEAANALVQGAGSEERLISSARHVASCTAQLLVACKVKADPSAESTRRLQAAGGEVIRSTDGLVRAARDAISSEEERSLVLNRRMVGGIAQEIDARSEVLRIEKELEDARTRLTLIRQAKYRARSSGDETDTDALAYSSDASAPQRFKKQSSSFANTTYSPNSSYTPHTTQNTSGLSHHVSQLNQSIHGLPTSPGYAPSPNSGYGQRPSSGQNASSFGQNDSYGQTGTNYAQNTSYSQNTAEYGQSGYTQSNGSFGPKSPGLQSPTFSSFRPQDDQSKQNYEGFTTRYETRLFDTPRPTARTEENYESTTQQHFREQKYGYDSTKSPMSPKFNARELKFEDKPEPIYSTLNKPGTPKFDGIGQTFSEHQKSTEAIPGGTKHSEFTVKSESYQSYPKTEFSKTETRHEVRSPFATSTPAKSDFFSQHPSIISKELVQAPEFERISSPYGKETHSYGGPNYTEETTTEFKEIPNGTQKVTKTKIYSSSPVAITSTNTKYEPIKLDGIDELAKSFDSESKYSTLDSKYNTLDSKLSSDTSRSFMRPSEFQTSDFQTSTMVSTAKKPSELIKEIEGMDKKFSKQTIKSETIERKSVMTSSHKSESSSTVTKKFGNF